MASSSILSSSDRLIAGNYTAVSDAVAISLNPAPISKRFLAYTIDLSLTISLFFTLFTCGVLTILGVTEMMIFAGLPEKYAEAFLGLFFSISSIALYVSTMHVYFWLNTKRRDAAEK